MVNVYQLVLSLPWLSSGLWSRHLEETQIVYDTVSLHIFPSGDEPTSKPIKSVAIVGAGSAGLAALKTFLDVTGPTAQVWDIVVFEQRSDIGGVWLPDPQTPHPPNLPETPLYPMLRTNTPHPSMTYPGLPFRPMTNLYPQHEAVWQYHSDFVSRFNLTSYIRVNHTVIASSWSGNSTDGFWNLTFSDNEDRVNDKLFDHLIVASGHNYFPFIPKWPGQEKWLENSFSGKPKREILHSVFWRGPKNYKNKTVLVLGTGASARDAIRHTAAVAKKMYLSLKDVYTDPEGLPQHEVRPPISHFTPNSIIFEDGSSCSDVDSIILGTGYELRVPFLENGNMLRTIPNANSNATYDEGLVTNLRYIFPLYQHIISLTPQYPPTALAFIGLPSLIANFPSDTAQSLFAIHAIVNPKILPSREEMIHDLTLREERLRAIGLDPYYIGHRLISDNMTPFGSYGLQYQDDLVQYLKEHGAMPNDGKNFVEGWRRQLTNTSGHLWDVWIRIENTEREREWLEGVKTEEDWANLLDRLAKWEID